MMGRVSSSYSGAIVAFLVLLPTIILQAIVVKAEDDVKHHAPYLSASFSTRISPVSDSLFDDTKKEEFSKSAEKFFQKVFDDHQAKINIVSVGVFDEHITKRSADEEVSSSSVAAKFQFQQYPSGDHALTFSTVVVAQHCQDEKQLPLMSSDNFHQNVLYAANDFQDHFLTFLRRSEDLYFSGVDTIIFDKYQANGKPSVSSTESENSSGNTNIMGGMSEEMVNTVSITVIVIGCVLSAIFLFASFKLHQKRKELIRNRWKVEELNLRAVAGNKSLEVSQTSDDDFSFDPLVTYNNINGNNFFTDITSLSSNRSSSVATAMPSPLFEPQTSTNSYTEELHRLPRDQIYAPPGKLGVAIDIFNGQPVVQKIRKGSPITGMLQVGDIILAIDDVDTTCMSLAEVTFLMVKNMERVRRITFARRHK